MEKAFVALGCFAVTAATSPSSRPPQRIVSRAACDASLAFIRNFVSRSDSRRLVFVSEDDAPRGDLINQRWRNASNAPAPEPPRSLIKKLERDGGLNAISRCAQIRGFLNSRGIPYGRDAADRAQTPRKDFTYGAEIVSVSLAVVSADGEIALLSASAASAPLAASGAIHELDRDRSSQWRITKSAIVWIS